MPLSAATTLPPAPLRRGDRAYRFPNTDSGRLFWLWRQARFALPGLDGATIPTGSGSAPDDVIDMPVT